MVIIKKYLSIADPVNFRSLDSLQIVDQQPEKTVNNVINDALPLVEML